MSPPPAARGAGSKGFGNARDVKNLFAACLRCAESQKERHAGERFGPSAPTMIMVDVLGAPPSRKTNKALHAARASSRRGWGSGSRNPIRTAVDALVLTVFENYQRELCDKPTEFPLNRLLWATRTGKTSFAKIYGRIPVNLLSDGTADKSASAFVGNVGRVPKADERHPQPQRGQGAAHRRGLRAQREQLRQGGLNTLVERVQNNPGDDIAVIMCGYEPETLKMLDEANPPAPPLQPRQHVQVYDFTDEELGVIMKRSAKAMKVRLPGDVLRAAVGHLSKKRAMANFGNAGLVKSLLAQPRSACGR